MQDPSNEYEDMIPCIEPLINLDSPEWKKDVRTRLSRNFNQHQMSQLLVKKMDVQDDEDEEYDLPLCHSKLELVREALMVVGDLIEFGEFCNDIA